MIQFKSVELALLIEKYSVIFCKISGDKETVWTVVKIYGRMIEVFNKKDGPLVFPIEMIDYFYFKRSAQAA